MKYLAGICDKKNSIKTTDSLKQNQQHFLESFFKFLQHWRSFSQKFRKKRIKSTEFTLFSRKFKPRYLPVKKRKSKKSLNSLFYAGQAF